MKCCGIPLINRMMLNGAYYDNSPYPLSRPVITSECDPFEVDCELTSSTGTWQGEEPINFTYQWFKDGVAIPSETNPSYTPTTTGTYKTVVTGIDVNGNINKTESIEITIL